MFQILCPSLSRVPPLMCSLSPSVFGNRFSLMGSLLSIGCLTSQWSKPFQCERLELNISVFRLGEKKEKSF